MNVMLDLETMSTAPNAAIITIGAVKFDQEKILDRIQIPISLESCVDAGLHMEPSTVSWWMSQSDEARKAATVKGLSLEMALLKFSAWMDHKAYVWGNGASFDNVILQSAYKVMGVPLPWLHWNDMCYRTIKNLNKHIKLKRVGTYHKAVDDAESQALHLISIWDNGKVAVGKKVMPVRDFMVD